VNWTDVLLGLHTVSPWILGLLVLVYAFTQYLKYRSGKKEDLFLASIDSRFEMHEAVTQKIQGNLEVHMNDHQAVVERQLAVLESIEQQLVTLNSKQGPLNMKNQRLMIQYQWNWFRDEVIAIACTSIRKNGFKGREEAIARKVANAWKLASREAVSSVARLEGVTYQFDKLFNHSFVTILPRVWKWMLPIYTAGNRSTCLEPSLEDLAIRIRGSFEQEMTSYFNEQADIDTGHLYRKSASGEFNSGLRELLYSMGYQDSDSEAVYNPTGMEV
jgi:hypothetical protein